MPSRSVEIFGRLYPIERVKLDARQLNLCGLSIIIVAQHPAKALSAVDLPVCPAHLRVWDNQLIVQALMIALSVIMRQVLTQRITQ